jgi:hypothetical protein
VNSKVSNVKALNNGKGPTQCRNMEEAQDPGTKGRLGFSWGEVGPRSLRTSGTVWPIVPALDDR